VANLFNEALLSQESAERGCNGRRLTEYGVNVSFSVDGGRGVIARALYGNDVSDLSWDCLMPVPTNCCQLHKKPTGPNKHNTVLSS
jgi:hypothetical protein